MRWIAAVSLAFLALAHSHPATALEVRGSHFVDQGQILRLKGIAMGDVGDLPADENPYPEIAREWGANIVRLSVHPGYWRDDSVGALARLTQHVEWAREAGLYVIIDYHAIGWPDGYRQDFFVASDSETTDWYDTRMSLALDFWRAVASTFRDNDILFELWNEPVSSNDKELANDGGRWRELVPFWQQLTHLIRGQGNANVILAAGAGWAFDLSGMADYPLADANTAYVWHVYPGGELAPFEPNLASLREKKPVIVTEWGFEPGSKEHWSGTAKGFGEPFAALLDEYELSYTGWCWNYDYGPALRKTDGRSLTPWGAFLKRYLRAN
ncbi:cellulase family glycosylhydrolase [Dongia sp.]|uniref:cellulase family glycosylhydrolase n=1 Tax=Dongia sp. TaxID=1977262 RepID=UPI0035B1F31D